MRSGNRTGAIRALGCSLQLAPLDAEGWNAIGCAHAEWGDLEVASSSYHQAIRLRPDFAEPYSNIANLLRKSGESDKAAAACRNAISLNPSFLGAHFNLGLTASGIGNIEYSLRWFQRSVRLNPDFVEGWNNLGDTLMSIGELVAAEKAFQNALRRNGGHVMARVNLANLSRCQGNYSKAESYALSAIALQPNLAEAYGNLGNIRRDLMKPRGSEVSYRRALFITPSYADALSNLGNLLRDLLRLEEAIDILRRAICFRPAFYEAYFNLGVTLYRQGGVHAAHGMYRKSIELKPDFSEAILAKGFLYLAEGRYAEGWDYYERRFDRPDLGLRRNEHEVCEWNGEDPLSGKSILVYAEQGLGDTLQFSRFALVLERMGADVTLEVQRPLVEVMSGNGSAISVVEDGHGSGRTYDYQVPLMSLPHRFKTTVESIPPCYGRLAYSQDKILEWRIRLGPRRKPRVGFVFSGNQDHVNDHIRSIAWGFADALFAEEIDIICLQKELRLHDGEYIERRGDIRVFCSAITDFTDTAALCAEMDLIISVDTSVAHLSASLGKPTWVLIPFMPDWRWMIDKKDSPWYPTITLYRKKLHESWEHYFASIRSEMDDFIFTITNGVQGRDQAEE